MRPGPSRAWSPVRALSVLASCASVACVVLSLAAPALPSSEPGRTHIRATPIPHDRGYLPRSGRYVVRTREGASRLCDRWRARVPPANPWVEALTPGLRASPIPLRTSGRGMVKSPCLIHGLEKQGGDGRRRGDRGAEASVTKIADSCQAAVRATIGGIARFSGRARGEEIGHRLSGCEPIVNGPRVAGPLKARTRQSRMETPSGQSGSFSAGG